MIEHEAEIFSRPARTWFQTNKEKQKAEGSFKNFQFLDIEFDMILIDLSKSLHESGGKTNDKKKSTVANDKVAILLIKSHLTSLTFIHLLSQVGINFLASRGKPNDGK